MKIPDEPLRKALAEALGEPAVLAADLHWDMRNPCSDCPFLKSTPFHQGIAKSVPAVHESIEQHTFSHSCHKTDTRPQCDGPVRGKETGRPVQHCAGAILMVLKTGKGADLQLPLLKAMESGKISAKDVQKMTRRAKRDANIFTLRGFIDFYRRKLEAMLKRSKTKKGV